MKARMENGRTEDIKAVWFENGKVRMIDQRELPLKLVIVDFEASNSALHQVESELAL